MGIHEDQGDMYAARDRARPNSADLTWTGSCQEACKPGSVPRAVSLKDRPRGGSHSSRSCVAARLKQPTRVSRGEAPLPAVLAIGGRETPIRPCSGWGLPCEACRQAPGAPLPHPFTLACAHSSKKRGPSAVYSLWHFPCAKDRSPCRGGHYPPPLRSWSPDFPRCSALAKHRGCPASWRGHA